VSGHAAVSVLRDHAAGARLPRPVLDHLESCRECAAALQAERRLLDEIDATLDGLRTAEPSPALMARARALADTPAAAPWAVSVFGIAAAALVVIGVAVTVVRQLSLEPPSPTPAPTAITSAPESPVTPEIAPSAPPAPRPVRRRAVARPIVPPGQEALVERFAALVDGGVVEAPERIVRPDEACTPLLEPSELVLPPLAITAIEAEEAPSEESR
jgi:anti-sigma factor RsiW